MQLHFIYAIGLLSEYDGWNYIMIWYMHVKYKMLHVTQNHVQLVSINYGIFQLHVHLWLKINCQWQLQNANFLLVALLWWSSDQFEEKNDLWKLSSIWIKILNEIAWLLNWIEFNNNINIQLKISGMQIGGKDIENLLMNMALEFLLKRQ
jgi:hypothetical protein